MNNECIQHIRCLNLCLLEENDLVMRWCHKRQGRHYCVSSQIWAFLHPGVMVCVLMLCGWRIMSNRILITRKKWKRDVFLFTFRYSETHFVWKWWRRKAKCSSCLKRELSHSCKVFHTRHINVQTGLILRGFLFLIVCWCWSAAWPRLYFSSKHGWFLKGFKEQIIIFTLFN